MNRNSKIALIIGGAAVAFFIGWPFVAGALGVQTGIWSCLTGPGMMGFSTWGWIMPVLMILFWGIVVWGIVWLVRGFTRSSGAESVSINHNSALDLLKRRYAAGEINKAEYEDKKRDMTQ